MNKTEKIAFREAIIVVMMGAVINFPLQTYLLWLTIDSWQWSDPLKISIFIQVRLFSNGIRKGVLSAIRGCNKRQEKYQRI